MKKRLLLIVTLFILVFCACGCSHRNVAISKSDILKGSPFAEIPGEDDLIYHTKSRTVFVVYFYTDSTRSGQIYSIGAPYIQNGHFCEYRDGEIVEVITPQ